MQAYIVHQEVQRGVALLERVGKGINAGEGSEVKLHLGELSTPGVDLMGSAADWDLAVVPTVVPW